MTRPEVQMERRRLEMLAKLDRQKSSAQRNRWGQYATPAELAEQMVKTSLQYLPQQGTLRFLEPGLGTGSFFSALRSTTARIGFAKGIELDPLFVKHAKQLWLGSGLRIVQGDFTDLPPPVSESSKFDLVISNPPYVRHHHIEPSKKRAIQSKIASQLNIRISGLAGLYAHFMLLSAAWMSRDGMGAWLVPAEFLDVNYGAAVRRFLLDHVSLLRIHRFEPEDVQFDDALVTSAVVFFRRARPTADHEIQFTRGGTLQTPTTTRVRSAAQLRDAHKWNSDSQVNPTNPANANQWRVHQRHASERSGEQPNENGAMLSDLFSIKRGIATGCNRFFVLDQHQVIESGLPRQFLRPILPSPKHLTDDIVMADGDGFPTLDNPKYLLHCTVSRAQVKRQSASLDRYLTAGEQAGIDRGYLCRNRRCWFHQEHRDPPPFLCTYMGRHSNQRATPFRFIWNQSDAIAANVYLMLYPRPNLAQRLGADPELHAKLFQCLNAITAESLIGEGRVYGGGLHKVEPKELAKVRVPGFDGPPTE